MKKSGLVVLLSVFCIVSGLSANILDNIKNFFSRNNATSSKLDEHGLDTTNPDYSKVVNNKESKEMTKYILSPISGCYSSLPASEMSRLHKKYGKSRISEETSDYLMNYFGEIKKRQGFYYNSFLNSSGNIIEDVLGRLQCETHEDRSFAGFIYLDSFKIDNRRKSDKTSCMILASLSFVPFIWATMGYLKI